MKQGHIIDNGVLKQARIIDVTCTGKYQYIKYEFPDKTYSSRIYCSEKQCDSLKKEPVIDIKVGKDDTVVIAKKDFNENKKGEIIAIYGLSIFLSLALLRNAIDINRSRFKS